MEDNNKHQLNSEINSNSINYSKGEDFGISFSNNDSDIFHNFENKSFNYTKLQEEYGELKKESFSSK